MKAIRIHGRGGPDQLVYEDAPQPHPGEEAKAYDVRPVWFVVEPNREQLIQIGALIDAGQIRPIIETVLPLAQARQAYEQGAKGHTRGKIVLRVVDGSPPEYIDCAGDQYPDDCE
jgi:NADPH:quinone reductase-like Zn-dependent oxidoreductase